MRLCKSHWNELRSAIDDRGLSGLVNSSGEDLMAALIGKLQGDEADSFDPLFNANWAIMVAFVRATGLPGRVPDVCPLCEVDKARSGLAANWIVGAADDQLMEARRLGLAPTLQ